jgi:hypothetical protein
MGQTLEPHEGGKKYIENFCNANRLEGRYLEYSYSCFIIVKNYLLQALPRISFFYMSARRNVLLQRKSKYLPRKLQKKHKQTEFFLLVCATI